MAPGGWDAAARGQVETLFDELSREWHTRLRSEEVAAVLPGEWRGVASRAGQGSWCVLRRA